MNRFIIVISLLFFSCTEKRQNNKSGTTAEKNKPVFQVNLLPLGKIDKKAIDQLYKNLLLVLPAVKLVAVEPMPAQSYYKPRNRYRADTLISWLRNRSIKGEVWLGVTSQDISTTKGDNPDSGVMGLGFQPGKACVASDYRLKNKKSLFKVAIHELGHNTGLPHCPEIHCYMRDARGGNPTDEETGFCKSCTQHLLKYGWRL
jgi:archaemetzincin